MAEVRRSSGAVDADRALGLEIPITRSRGGTRIEADLVSSVGRPGVSHDTFSMRRTRSTAVTDVPSSAVRFALSQRSATVGTSAERAGGRENFWPGITEQDPLAQSLEALVSLRDLVQRKKRSSRVTIGRSGDFQTSWIDIGSVFREKGSRENAGIRQKLETSVRMLVDFFHQEEVEIAPLAYLKKYQELLGEESQQQSSRKDRSKLKEIQSKKWGVRLLWRWCVASPEERNKLFQKISTRLLRAPDAESSSETLALGTHEISQILRELETFPDTCHFSWEALKCRESLDLRSASHEEFFWLFEGKGLRWERWSSHAEQKAESSAIPQGTHYLETKTSSSSEEQECPVPFLIQIPSREESLFGLKQAWPFIVQSLAVKDSPFKKISLTAARHEVALHLFLPEAPEKRRASIERGYAILEKLTATLELQGIPGMREEDMLKIPCSQLLEESRQEPVLRLQDLKDCVVNRYIVMEQKDGVANPPDVMEGIETRFTLTGKGFPPSFEKLLKTS